MKLKLNVYPVIPDMEEKIAQVIQEAVDKRARMVEIAYGEAGGSVEKTEKGLGNFALAKCQWKN